MSHASAIHIYQSHRIETLTEALGELLSSAPGGPFEPEVVVAHGRGMARYLSAALAREHGCSANVRFLYPRGLIDELCTAVLGAPAQGHALVGEDALLWALLDELPERLGEEHFARLRRYLKDDARGIKLFQLCDRIATRFDQYLTYRPRMIGDWEAGRDDGTPEAERWQPVLWRAVLGRALADQPEALHLARLEDALHEALGQGVRAKDLPARVSLFGISSLPPLFMRLVGALAGQLVFHLFNFTPTAHPEWPALALDGEPQGATTAADANRLLVSWGQLGAEHARLLHQQLAAAGATLVVHPLAAPQPAAGVLGSLQNAIIAGASQPTAPRLELEHRGGGAAGPTVAVHACHGPMREVEVLHDQLLDLLGQPDSTLQPHEIIVMVPDLERYAPLIEAVFARPTDHPQHIPFRIADRPLHADRPLVQSFERLLGLVGSRLSAPDVLDLLSEPAVQRCFDLDAEEVGLIGGWIHESGIRWGIDAGHRAAHGQPANEQNTWRFGLRRLLLGFAMPTGGRRTFAGSLPYDHIEGQDALLLGRFAHFAETLFHFSTELIAPRPVEQWVAALDQLADTMLAPGGSGDSELAMLHRALGTLGQQARTAAFSRPVALPAIRQLLERRIDGGQTERGFFSGGLGFCAMVPMRSIPFRVVCLLGMNDQAFPRSSAALDFDLIRRGPQGRQPGDRDRRRDDRYLMLEALMAARERLIVTYTGRSARDGAALPPSVVVGELLDEIARESDPPGACSNETDRRLAVRAQIVTDHPLHGFSPRYYDGSDPRLYSYAALHTPTGGAPSDGTAATAALFDAPLPEPSADAREAGVALFALMRFFRNPAAYLVERRLDVRFDELAAVLADREPMELDGLAQHRLGTTLIDQRLAGLTAEQSRELLRAGGELPGGTVGMLRFAELDGVAGDIAAAVQAWQQGGPRESMVVDSTLPSGTRLHGELAGMWSRGMLRHGFSKLRATHRLAMWIEHLALCFAAGALSPAHSALIGRNAKDSRCEVLRHLPVEAAAELLDRLAALYFEGQRAPLAFAPESSLEYARRRLQGQPHDQALAAARNCYLGTGWGLSERDRSASLARVFGSSGPPFEELVTVGPAFDELAMLVWAPLLEAEAKAKEAAS